MTTPPKAPPTARDIEVVKDILNSYREENAAVHIAQLIADARAEEARKPEPPPGLDDDELAEYAASLVNERHDNKAFHAAMNGILAERARAEREKPEPAGDRVAIVEQWHLDWCDALAHTNMDQRGAFSELLAKLDAAAPSSPWERLGAWLMDESKGFQFRGLRWVPKEVFGQYRVELDERGNQSGFWRSDGPTLEAALVEALGKAVAP